MSSGSLERVYLAVGHREELEVSKWVRIHHCQIMPSGGVECWMSEEKMAIPDRRVEDVPVRLRCRPVTDKDKVMPGAA
jgi:hypothetical protein